MMTCFYKRFPFLKTDTGLLVMVGMITALVHILSNGGYGFHRDELDILMNAQYPAWGYVAYPPLTPFLARLEYWAFGFSLTGLRLLPAVFQGGVVVLAGLMARDFGGNRRAQAVAAVATAISPIAITTGTLMQYLSFDYAWWVLLSFCVVRLLRSEDRRWWLGAGAAIGLGMLTKYTMVFFIAGLAAAVLLTQTRRDLRSKWLWAGAGLSLLIALPNLIWQVQHDFISLQFLGAIHERDIAWGRTQGFLLEQLYAVANPFTLPLWAAGLLACLRGKWDGRFKLVGWWFGVTFLLLFLSRGRGYYLAPAYPMLLAAGAAWVEGWLEGQPGRTRGSIHSTQLWVAVFGAAFGLLLLKPVLPINSALWPVATSLSDNFVEMVGWPDLVDQVEAVVKTLPEGELDKTVILAGNYGEAGALMFYGAGRNLPRVIGGGNSLWERGYGSPEPEIVVAVGFERSQIERFMRSCQAAGTVSNRYGVENEESTCHTTLFICREPRAAWAVLWPQMRWFQ
ncbi:MAG TPA: glycosyltransferase family 39 protein [Anaerolineaceae bacterium]|nr:glycosyltransferase family 39 protein [Anaerolineaceae bacterium]HPN52201.1 glycosyltransferase family 39 protein [Anaerolineaceae bacterium]